jgi:uncharacterized protein YeaO (DUF488 family)
MVKIKRIYEDYSPEDGYRVLVDRLWPRGVSKEKAQINLWLKEIAPSTELRKWFGHDPEKWSEFEKRYRKELSSKEELIAQLKELKKKHKQITLLFGAKDRTHNEAIILQKIFR